MKRAVKCKICGNGTKLLHRNLFDDRHGYPGKFNIYRCGQCGFAQTEPQLSRKKIASVYRDFYPRQNIEVKKLNRGDYSQPDRSKLRRNGLMTNCHYLVPSGSDVLDIGCGLGFSLLELESNGCRAWGIDPDSNATKVAKRFKLKFHQGFIEDQPFGRRKFDYICGSQVLEHTNNPKRFLLECKKRLKPEGKIILSFPNIDSLSLKLFGKKWLHWHLPFHLNFFSKNSIQKLASDAGLVIEHVETETPNLWTNLQLRRLLINPKVDQRDMFWDSGVRGAEENSSTQSQFYLSWLKRGFALLESHNYFNRLVDAVGEGDSFIVVLALAQRSK